MNQPAHISLTVIANMETISLADLTEALDL
jgi:hypothetical protein